MHNKFSVSLRNHVSIIKKKLKGRLNLTVLCSRTKISDILKNIIIQMLTQGKIINSYI